MALSITSEGTEVAEYLSARGVTAFVLKYRLAHTAEDATQEFASLYADRPKFEEKISGIIPLSIADAFAAVTYVRQHASEFGISPDRVGIMLQLMNLEDRKITVLASLFGGQGTINVPSWSPDSNRLAFVSYALLAPEDAHADAK